MKTQTARYGRCQHKVSSLEQAKLGAPKYARTRRCHNAATGRYQIRPDFQPYYPDATVERFWCDEHAQNRNAWEKAEVGQ